jgi:hypothetical protein
MHRLIVAADSYDPAMSLPSNSNSCQRVGMSGARSYSRNSRSTGDPGPDISHMYGGRLVTRIDNPDAGIEASIVNRVNGAPTQGEEMLDSLLLESLHNQPSAFYFPH